MRIGIDARELCGRPTGVGRYLNGLLANWAVDPAAACHEFVLYAPEPLPLALDGRRFASRVVAGGGGTIWEQARMPASAAGDHLDVFFAPAYTAPMFRRLPTVVAIHDVSFAAHPEWFPVRRGARMRWLARMGARQARAVITISEFSRGEIVEHLGVADSVVHVVPPGIAVPVRSGAASAPTVLYVGSIFNRRRVPDLIRGVGMLARDRPDVSLDLVGDDRSYPREHLHGTIRAEGLEARVRWRHYVDEAELSRLYGTSRAFAFLSEYEGLGLTPLEALAAGIPPLLLDTPVARESCGPSALYVPAPDARLVARALDTLLFDEGTRQALLAAAPAVLARYDWPRSARETLAVIESAA